MNALPERREALFTEAFCKECESATPIIISHNLLVVELACDVCEANIRYTVPRFGLDYCVECGMRVLDGEKYGFEGPDGQRGHAYCQQRENARLNRTHAAYRHVEGNHDAAQRLIQLAVDADRAADEMEADK